MHLQGQAQSKGDVLRPMRKSTCCPQRPGIFGVAVWLETRTTAAEIIRPSKRVWAFRQVVVLWVCQKGFLVVVVSAAPSSMCDGVRE